MINMTQPTNPMAQLKDVFGLMAQMKHVFAPIPAPPPMPMAPPMQPVPQQQGMMPMGYHFQQTQNILPRLQPAETQYSIPSGYALIKKQ
jgi:hypothetical protein